jgi:hypothetical protein
MLFISKYINEIITILSIISILYIYQSSPYLLVYNTIEPREVKNLSITTDYYKRTGYLV